MAPRPRLLVALLALLLGGCLEVEERLTFEREGNGVYSLRVAWDADLLARVRDTAGERVVRAFDRPAFPLSAQVWRDGLTGLQGLTIQRLEERAGEPGWRSLEVEIAFGRIADLLRWELLAGRALSIAPSATAGQAHLVMQPLARVPVLDALREAFEARRAPPPAAPPSEARRDPDPWTRLGLREETLALLERQLLPRLGRVRLSFEIAPAGRVLTTGPRAVDLQPRSARFEWGWAQLLDGTSRTLELAWTPGEFDRIPAIENPAPDS